MASRKRRGSAGPEQEPDPGSLLAIAREREQALRRGHQLGYQKLSEMSGGDSAACRELGIPQQTINAAKKPGGVFGPLTLLQLSVATGKTLDEIERLSTSDAVMPIRRGMIVLGEASEWADAVEDARATPAGARLPDWAWRAAGGVSLPMLPRAVTPELATVVATLVADHCDASQAIRVRRRRPGEEKV